MKKSYRFTYKRILKAFATLVCLQMSFFSFGQTIDDFCNCERGFPTQTPKGAYHNGVILASKFFTFLPPAARRVVSNRCFVIDAPFVFDEPVIRRFSNCNFTMTEGASIIIPEGKPGFHFRGGSMKSCDGELWSGIQIQKNAFIDLEATTLGGAQTAVQVQDSAILNVRGTIFDGNVIGVDVLPDAAPLGVPLFGNTFRNGSVGVNNMGLLYVGASSSTNNFGPNLSAGVIGTNGITNIKNSVFKECNVGVLTSNSTAIDMTGNKFQDCAYGIQDVNSNIKVEENVFRDIQFTAIQLLGHIGRQIDVNFNIIDGWYGIEGSQIFSDNMNIRYNNITAKGNFYSGISMSGVFTNNSRLERNTIFGTDDVLDGAAILLSSCNGLDVNQNYIELQSGRASGLSIVNTYNALISENTVTGTQQQIGATLENAEIDLYCNEFFNHANGILVKGFSMSDIATNFIAGSEVGVFYQKTAMSGPQDHNGNLWHGNALGAFHGNNDKTFYELSTFKVASDETPIHPGQVFPVNWFALEEGEETAECGSASRAGNSSGKTNPRQIIYDQIAKGTLYESVENAALQYESERFLVKKLVSESNIQIASDDFYKKRTRIEGLNQVQKSIDNLTNFNPEIYSAYLATQKEIVALNEEIEKFKEKGSYNLEKTGGKKAEQVLSGYLSDLKELVVESQLIQTELQKDFKFNVKSIQSNLDQIPVTQVFEKNEKFVQNILLEMLLNGRDNITVNQISQLKTLAAGNPHADGMAVYKAKSLLLKIENKTPVIDFEISLPGFKLPVVKSKSQKLNLGVYPNPTTEVLFVSFPQNSQKGSRKAKVYDLTGRQIISAIIEQNSVNVSAVPEGLYFLKVFENDRLIGTEKFSIVR